MAKEFNVDKILSAGPRLRIASNPAQEGFWLLSLVVNNAVVGSPIPVTQKEAEEFYLSLPGFLQACILAMQNKVVGFSDQISLPLASGVTISIQYDSTLVGFWNLSFSAGGQALGSPVPITGPEASALTQDVKNIYFITLSK